MSETLSYSVSNLVATQQLKMSSKQTIVQTITAKLIVFCLLFLYNDYFFIIRKLHSILSLGKVSLLTFLQNDFKEENFHIDIGFPFYYYGSFIQL